MTIHPDLPERSPINVAGWRKAYERLLRGASEVSAPSEDAARRIGRYFGGIEINVRPHHEVLDHIPIIGPSSKKNDKLRVVIVGAIGPHKGSRVLLAVARDATVRNLPIEYCVVGFSDIDDELREAGVTITGKYVETDVGVMLRDQYAQVAFLPSVWPETYCYTLSIVRAARLPTCVFDLGAQADRLRQEPDVLLLPLAFFDEPHKINDSLLRFGNELATAAAA